MRAGVFSKEYPPEIYGGAGVHVAELTRFMREIIDVSVHCMGSERDEKDVFVHGVDPALKEANAALQTLSTGLRMANAASDIDVAHSHTWYTGLGGHLAAAVNRVAADKELTQRFGSAGRQRAIDDFSWATIAQQTVDIYRSLM